MAKVKTIAGQLPPKCRFCGRLLKPNYHTVEVVTEAAAASNPAFTDLYWLKAPHVGETWHDQAILLVEEVHPKFRPPMIASTWRIWTGRWSYGNKFCGPTCAAKWALRHAT